MRGGEGAWFWSDRSSPPGRQAPTNTGQTGLRTRSGVINRFSGDWPRREWDGKARAAEVAPGFARQELLPGDDLADLVVRVAHLLYVVGLELPFEEILLESFAAHVLKVALHARLHVFVFRVNDRSGGDIAGEKQGPGIRRKRERQPLHGTGDARDLRDDAVGDNRARHEDRSFPELHEPVGIVFKEAHQIAQMANPGAQMSLELLTHRLFQFVHFAGESGG